MYFWHEETNEVKWEVPLVKRAKVDDALQLTDVEAAALESTFPGIAVSWALVVSQGGETQEFATLVKFKTRLEDWRDGGLSTAFFCQRISEMAGLEQKEFHGATAEDSSPNSEGEENDDNKDEEVPQVEEPSSNVPLGLKMGEGHHQLDQGIDPTPCSHEPVENPPLLQSSILLFVANSEEATTANISAPFAGCGPRHLRVLGEGE